MSLVNTPPKPTAALEVLQNHYGALSPELRRAAKWIADHPSEVALQSMREQARQAQVSPATMVRLAQALGYADFLTFKQPFQQALTGDSGKYRQRAAVLQSHAGKNKVDTFLADSVALQVGDLQSAASLNTVTDLEAAVRLIAKGRRVAFLGLRASFAPAYQFHYAYNLIFPNGVLLQDQGGTLLDQLGELDHRDVLIAISLAPYTTQTVRAVERAAAQGVTVLALTDSRLSPLATPAAQALLFQAESLSFFQSMTGVLGLLELLLALLAAQGGRPVLERIARMEAQLKQSQAYWDARHTRPRPKPLATHRRRATTTKTKQ